MFSAHNKTNLKARAQQMRDAAEKLMAAAKMFDQAAASAGIVESYGAGCQMRVGAERRMEAAVLAAFDLVDEATAAVVTGRALVI